MNQKEELLKKVLAEFNELVEEHGFSKPIISLENWITRVDYLNRNIAIELELDWRDFEVFTLIVRLENGFLPNGYYVANGKKCRKHLANIYREQQWIKPVSKHAIERKTQAKSDFNCAIDLSKKMVMEHLPSLLEKGESLFI